MARNPRLQFAGALYHVINRGNYRQDVFVSEKTRAAFVNCLDEACEYAGWRLHAYVVMRNHFHLALETPRPNLVEGMHWLESTFSIRFNRLRKEHGHLFQGRYKSLLIEPGPHLAYVVNYIHLNPVKARVVPVDQLLRFPWSSYPRFLRKDRPGHVVCSDWLHELGELEDSPNGWQSYQSYLEWLSADSPAQKEQAFATLCDGWAVGRQEWRDNVAKDHSRLLSAYRLRGGRELLDLKERVWAAALEVLFEKAGKSPEHASKDRKGASWKIRMALELRKTTTATNAWIARQLVMGTPNSVSAYLSSWRSREI